MSENTNSAIQNITAEFLAMLGKIGPDLEALRISEGWPKSDEAVTTTLRQEFEGALESMFLEAFSASRMDRAA